MATRQVFLLAVIFLVPGARPFTNAPGVDVVDFATPDIKLLTTGARVLDVFDGEHWDDVLRDTPDAGNAALIRGEITVD